MLPLTIDIVLHLLLWRFFTQKSLYFFNWVANLRSFSLFSFVYSCFTTELKQLAIDKRSSLFVERTIEVSEHQHQGLETFTALLICVCHRQSLPP